MEDDTALLRGISETLRRMDARLAVIEGLAQDLKAERERAARLLLDEVEAQRARSAALHEAIEAGRRRVKKE